MAAGQTALMDRGSQSREKGVSEWVRCFPTTGWPDCGQSLIRKRAKLCEIVNRCANIGEGYGGRRGGSSCRPPAATGLQPDYLATGAHDP